MPAAAPTKTIALSDLFAKRVRTVAIVFTYDDGDDEESFTVRYSPDEFTPKRQAEYEAAAAEDAQGAMASLMTAFIKSWSLTVDGEPYPVTADNLQALGLPIMGLIFQAVTEDMTDNVRLGKKTETPPPEDSNGP